jgi:hypothetical protein
VHAAHSGANGRPASVRYLQVIAFPRRATASTIVRPAAGDNWRTVSTCHLYTAAIRTIALDFLLAWQSGGRDDCSHH